MASSLKRLLQHWPSGGAVPVADAADGDPVTGLPNREAVIEELKRSLARMRNRAPTALVIIELSDMSDAPTLAPAADEALVRHLAERLREQVPQEHTLGRLRGREFGLIVSGLRMADVERIADRVVDGMRGEQRLHGHSRFVATIVGVGLSSRSDCNASHLLNIADVAIHYARATGRAWHAIADEVRGMRAA